MSIVLPNERGDGLSVVPPGTNSMSLPVPIPPPNSHSMVPCSTALTMSGMSGGVFLPGPVSMPLPVHTPPIKIMADHTTEKQHPPIPNNTDYLAQLLNDKKSLVLVPNMFMHVERMIDEEISKVRKNMYNINNDNSPLVLPEPQGPTITLSEKLFVPVKTYPDFNFVGRILGPRGMYAKQLEKETGCKIMIRGKGSMRDKKKKQSSFQPSFRSFPPAPRPSENNQEEMNKDKHNWEHLSEELHVLVTVEDTANRASLKMERAVSQVKKLLVPTADGEDELKKRQLMELAIINGTFRDTSAKVHPGSNPNTPLSKCAEPNNVQQFLQYEPWRNPSSFELPPGGCTFIPASPRQMMPPGTALIPQPLRSPTPAGNPQLIAHPSAALFPRMASGQTLLANGMAPPMVSTADGTSFMISPYEHYPYAVTPTMLDYPPTPSEGTIGAVPKLRRAIREHPYQRVLDSRDFPGMVMGATLPLPNPLMS